jgi:hypothetical protein
MSEATTGSDIDDVLSYCGAIVEDNNQKRLERKTALQALAYVLGRNFSAAEATEKDGVFSLNFKVTFDRSDYPTEVKAVARCSRISNADITIVCQESDRE